MMAGHDMKGGEKMEGHAFMWIAGGFAVLLGGAIAWVDTRSGWNDTDLTAGALLVVAGIAALSGLRWWLAAVLVVGPLLLAEIRGAGWGLVLAPVFAFAGALGGALLHRIALGPRG